CRFGGNAGRCRSCVARTQRRVQRLSINIRGQFLKTVAPCVSKFGQTRQTSRSESIGSERVKIIRVTADIGLCCSRSTWRRKRDLKHKGGKSGLWRAAASLA